MRLDACEHTAKSPCETFEDASINEIGELCPRTNLSLLLDLSGHSLLYQNNTYSHKNDPPDAESHDTLENPHFGS